MLTTSKPPPNFHSPQTQILTIIDDDDCDDLILPPLQKDPSAPGSSSSSQAPAAILIEPSDDDDIRVLRFKPTKTHFKRRRTNNTSLTDFPPFVCELCADDKPGYQSFPIENCRHVYCSDCVISYVNSKLEENEPTIRCPVPNCPGLLEREYCRSLLPSAVFERWGKAMCDAVIDGSEKFYCPYQDCSALMINDGDEVVEESQCPHCTRMFCGQCRVAWHVGMGCEEFQRLSADERGSEDVMLRNLAQSQSWRRCLSCKFYVEKSFGCSYMKCRCGFAFCYNCGVQALTHTSTCRSCRK